MKSIYNKYFDDNSMKDTSTDHFFKFGINSGFIRRFQYSTDGGFSGGLPAIIVEFVKNQGDASFIRALFREEIKMRVGNKELQFGTEAYEEERNKCLQNTMSTVYHFLEALNVTKDQIKSLLEKEEFGSFQEWARAITDLLPSDYNKIKVDLFLEWQYFLKEGKDKTYLQIPLNRKGGVVITPHMDTEGELKEIRTAGGLKYEDEQGREHPIKRNANFMRSNKANQQFAKDENSGQSSSNDVVWG